MVRRGPGLKVIVEGGGNDQETRTRCQRAFSKLTERAGFTGRMPKFVAGGGRRRAYDMFVTACEAGEPCMLLIDSEGPVGAGSAWDHVRRREGDGWERPNGARDEDLHLMVECMEAWIVADVNTLRRKYGQRLNEAALPGRSDVEQVPKRDLFAALARASGAGEYSKGKQAFELLEGVDPVVLRARCPWAERFFAELDRRTRA